MATKPGTGLARELMFAGLACAVLASSAMWGQAVAPMASGVKPSFEVATIKPSDPGATDRGFRTRGHRVIVKRQTLAGMVTFAYAVHRKQIVGGPAWMETDAYDIDGVADAEGEPDLKQMQEMLQKLLVERFGRKFHGERRELAHYALEVVKGGVKMVKSTAAADSQPGWTIDGDTKQALMHLRTAR